MLALAAAAFTLLAVEAGTAAQPLKKKPPKHHVRKKPEAGPDAAQKLAQVNHIVVIYEENHSFDNLYGGWEGVNGRSDTRRARTRRRSTRPDAVRVCAERREPRRAAARRAPTPTTGTTFTSHFPNAPFTIDDFIKPPTTTCPPTPNRRSASPNGFANGTGSAGRLHPRHRARVLPGAVPAQRRQAEPLRRPAATRSGSSWASYDTKAAADLQVPARGTAHPHYAIADDFFQAAFGGSFLNHQWLIAAATPTCPSAPASQHSIIDANGHRRRQLPALHADRPGDVRGRAHGRLPVAGRRTARAATTRSTRCSRRSSRSARFGAKLPPQTAPTIGDRLSAKGVDWAWYAGGWSNAAGDVERAGLDERRRRRHCADPNVIPPTRTYPHCPDNLFQFHHQPFNYFANYAPGTPGRAHLKDEAEFIGDARQLGQGLQPQAGQLRQAGRRGERASRLREHAERQRPPRRAAQVDRGQRVREGHDGDRHLRRVRRPVGSRHAAGPGGYARRRTTCAARGRASRRSSSRRSSAATFAVDHTQYDTTSILATIEQRWDLAPLSSRDAAVNSLSDVFDAKQVEAGN